ncbi:MAG: hypothetical protein HY850_07890 [Betaproteobacteria bacterium]|nr:hypothetical protein [Betaproteobacteria bacterium]
MRLPADNIPPTTVIENRYEIRQPDAVANVRPVAPNAAARQRYLPKRKQQGQGGYGQEQGEEAGERRSGEERRQQGRREAEAPVILDTRTDLDRRTDARRADDVGSKIDEYV